MRRYTPALPFWAKFIIGVLLIAAVFCLVVLIYGGVTGQGLAEVLQSWFGTAPTEPEPIEEALQVIGII